MDLNYDGFPEENSVLNQSSNWLDAVEAGQPPLPSH